MKYSGPITIGIVLVSVVAISLVFYATREDVEQSPTETTRTTGTTETTETTEAAGTTGMPGTSRQQQPPPHHVQKSSHGEAPTDNSDTQAAAPTNEQVTIQQPSSPSVVLAASESIADFQPDDETFTQTITPFLNSHCLKCHGSESQEGDFRVDQQLPNEFLRHAVSEKWNEVLNMLNAGEMPPADEPQPNVERATRVVEWIERELLRAEKSRRDRTIVLRRLNRQEYNNTIRELTGIDFQLADELPEDPSAAGFDNNGAALSVSPFHLERYLQVAEQILDRVLVDESQPPPTIKWRFELEQDELRTDHNRIFVDDRNQRVMMTRYSNQDRNGLVEIPYWGVGCRISYFQVPYPGEYIIRVRAAGRVPPESVVRVEGPRIDLLLQQERESKLANDAERNKARQQYDMWSRPSVRKHFETDRSYRYGSPRLKVATWLGSQQRIDAELSIDARPEEPHEYEIRTWFTPEKAGITLSNEYRIPHHHLNGRVTRHPEFPRPTLLIDWVQIEGPIHDAWPPSSHTRILIDSPHRDGDQVMYAREVLTNFMPRAWRRPVQQEELDAMLTLYQRVRADHASFRDAIKVPLIAVLSSPAFLYLVEETESDEHQTASAWLNDYQLASRLSYFLWSSMPDEELLQLAGSQSLSDTATLRAQVARMLADNRSGALVRNFAGQWLGLREVGVNPPVRDTYFRYDDHLQVSMRRESEAFFDHILRNNRSVLEFLKSDYVTIDERLARFYDIPGVTGGHFRPVKVPPGVPRGGLVTQAAILSITSNGTRTSPVWRGAWILENLLGDPPPPPPPNADDIPPTAQDRNQITLRERLELHREHPQCARCHNKIDPLGFALENFAASGEWRTREHRIYMNPPTQNDGPEIDARGVMPDGTQIEGIEGLQRELLKRQDQFLKCLAEKLYTYALGRQLGYADQPYIEAAVAAMKTNHHTLRSLIHHIVDSELFRKK